MMGGPPFVERVLPGDLSRRGWRDRTYRGYLLRENPWLQLQGGGASYSMSAMLPDRVLMSGPNPSAMSKSATDGSAETPPARVRARAFTF